MILRPFLHTDPVAISYLFGCGGKALAAVVDPVGEIEPYLRAADEAGMRILYVIDTHLHADHLSVGRQLAEAAGAEYVLFAEADDAQPFRGVRDGNVLPLGNVTADVLYTPGHTPEHICLLVTDRTRAAEPWFALTGHTLMVGDVGRTELAATAEEGARALSPSQFILSLPFNGLVRRETLEWGHKMGPLPLPDTRYLKQRRGQRRSGSRWYVRIAVPQDLRDQLGAQHIERSLDTGDLKEAQKRRHAALAEIFADFEKARRGTLTSGDIEHEAQLFLQERFKALQKRSDEICTPAEDALGNEMQPLAERALFELYAMQQEEHWPPMVEQAAEKIAKQYGATFGASQREEVCRALLHAEIQAHARVLGAHSGEVPKPVSVLNARAVDPITAEVAHPTRPSPKKCNALRVSEAAAAYIADRNREKRSGWTAQTRGQAETTFRLFADSTRDAQIDAITRRDVATFLDKIARLDTNYGRHAREKLSLDILLRKYPAKGEGLSNKTLNRHCGVLTSMFDWALRTGKLEGANPAKGHHRQSHAGDETTAVRRAFETEELKALLGGSLFATPYRDRVNPPKHTPDSTLAWLIPIALFTGMRLDEICGLRTEDVAEESGILFFDIVSHEGRRVKTAASRRRVPVHSELLRMGFDEYLANIQRQRHQYLFPALKPGGPDNKRSWYIGKRFTEYRRSVGVSDPNTTFHCLRKNTATALERARIPENEAVQILGHKKMTMSYGLYSGGLDLLGLQRAVEAISCPGVDLSLLHAPRAATRPGK